MQTAAPCRSLKSGQATRRLIRSSVAKSWDIKIEYELTREGAVYLLIAGLITIASANTGNNLLFIILAILLAGMLVSGILSKAVLSGLKVDLALPEHIFAGEPVHSQVTIRNLKRVVPAYSLTVTSRDRRRAWGRKSRARREPPRDILTSPVYAPYIPARGSVRERVELRFERRGRYNQNCFEVSTKFPFSILRRKRALGAGQEILVLPRVDAAHEFEAAFPLIRGEMERQRKGSGCDLYALRDYQAGDSARRVDWKATAKTQKLKVREFTREEDNRLAIIFDPSVESLSAQGRERFERAVSLCAWIAWQAYKDGGSLQFIGGGLKTAMAPASEVIYPVLEELATIEPITITDSEPELLFESGFLEGFPVIITLCPDREHLKNFPSSAHIIAVDGR